MWCAEFSPERRFSFGSSTYEMITVVHRPTARICLEPVLTAAPHVTMDGAKKSRLIRLFPANTSSSGCEHDSQAFDEAIHISHDGSVGRVFDLRLRSNLDESCRHHQLEH